MKVVALLLFYLVCQVAQGSGVKESTVTKDQAANLLLTYIDNKQVVVLNGLGQKQIQYVFGSDGSNLVGEVIFVSDSAVAFIPGHGGYESDVYLLDIKTGKEQVITNGGGNHSLVRGELGKYFFFLKNDDLIRVDLRNNTFKVAFHLSGIGKPILDWFAKNPEDLKHLRYNDGDVTSIETEYLHDLYVDTVTNQLYVSFDFHVFRFIPDTGGVEYINVDWAHKIVHSGPVAFYYFASKDGVYYFPLSDRKNVKCYFATHDRWLHREVVDNFWMLDGDHAYISLGEKDDKSLEDIVSYNWNSYLHYFDGKIRTLVKDTWSNIDVLVP